MSYKKTDRHTANCKSDYCVEWDNGTIVWIKDSAIVDSNDMLDTHEVNTLLNVVREDMLEYKYMYEELCK